MRILRGKRFSPLSSLWVCMLLLMGDYVSGEIDSKQPKEIKDTSFTPVVLSALSKPFPVKGSDGRVHVVYELGVTNATKFKIDINSLEILDGEAHEAVLGSYGGDSLASIMQGLVSKSSTHFLESGASAILFIHVVMEKDRTLPMNLVHRLTISARFPPGFNHFMGLNESQGRMVEYGARTELTSLPPIVIGPPLAGTGWVAADGCCTATRHVRAMMPINGKLQVAQRFAIDWEQLDAERRIYHGSQSDVESYVAYGKPVLAVADSTVVRMVDRFENQVPGKLPSGITIEEVNGNYIVLDLGNDQFAYYAHLQKGSITKRGIKVGDRVTCGQVLGLVGNTGNTTAPHLHFHVMSSPSPLGSDGLPYVFSKFELLGKIPSTAAFDKAEQQGTPLPVVKEEPPEIHKQELPLDLSLVNFPAGKGCSKFEKKMK